MWQTEERISKIIASHGICSRRAAEDLIRGGKVTVNGASAELGQKADAARDAICVNGRPLKAADEYIYVMLHKPRGYVTTVSDERGRKTVMDLLRDIPQRVWPVGRLDMDSEGLLLLTNDGALTNRLLHPSHEIDKVYHVWVEGDAVQNISWLRRMNNLDGETIRCPEVRVLRRTERGAILRIVIHEGKNRQIRRMCAAVSLRVTRLKRVQEGGVALGDLPRGAWRFLTQQEVVALQ